MPEIEDIKPTSILHKIRLVDRATDPFLPTEKCWRALTFQNIEDSVRSSSPPATTFTGMLGTVNSMLANIELGVI